MIFIAPIVPWIPLIAQGVQSLSSLYSQRRQEHFQERMSNTAYSRQMSDLYHAGLNPILGIAKGGFSPATTPSGSSIDPGQGISSAGAASANLKLLMKFQDKQMQVMSVDIEQKAQQTRTTEALRRVYENQEKTEIAKAQELMNQAGLNASLEELNRLAIPQRQALNRLWGNMDQLVAKLERGEIDWKTLLAALASAIAMAGVKSYF